MPMLPRIVRDELARIEQAATAKADAAAVATALLTKADAVVLPVTYTAAAVTLAPSDAGRVVRMNSPAPQTLTIPTNAAVPIPVGTTINGFTLGVGMTTFAPAGGVTLNGSARVTRAQHAAWSLYKAAADEWDLVGDLVA